MNLKAAKEAFSDGAGEVSMMRILSLLSLLVAFFVAGYDVLSDSSQGDNARYYFTLFLLGGFAPKVLQKYVKGLVGKVPKTALIPTAAVYMANTAKTMALKPIKILGPRSAGLSIMQPI